MVIEPLRSVPYSCKILLCITIEKGTRELQSAPNIQMKKVGGKIGRVLLVEFEDKENTVFDEIMEVIKRHPNIQIFEVKHETKISLPGLEINPNQRKIYRDRQEIHLTAKEYDLLCLLTANKGRVLTYAQIYESVWGDISSGNENTASDSISVI